MVEKQLEEFWQAALVEVAINLAPGAIDRWLKPLTPVSFENNTLTLSTDNSVIVKFLRINTRILPLMPAVKPAISWIYAES